MNVTFITDEMPDHCSECRFFRPEVMPDGMYHECFVCDATGWDVSELTCDTERDDRCPLIESNGDLYEKVELKEGTPVQFVGVYVLRWQHGWGEPTAGFVEVKE